MAKVPPSVTDSSGNFFPISPSQKGNGTNGASAGQRHGTGIGATTTDFMFGHLVADISVIVKVTEGCNLSCPYCYHRANLIQTGNATGHANMTSPVLENTIRKVLDTNHRTAHFIWHGGEPLIRGVDFFHHVVNLQKSLNRKKLVISNAIQTNGILLNSEWIQFFIENDFHIGISMDGPFDIQKRNRALSDADCSRLIDNVRSLKRKDVKFGCLAVVGANSIGREKDMLDFFEHNGVQHVGFLPLRWEGSSSNAENKSLSAIQWGRFLCALFDVWAMRENCDVSIREFEEILRFRKGLPMKHCVHLRDCRSYLTIDPSGLVFPCDCFGTTEKERAGSILDDPLSSILSSPPMQRLGYLNHNPPRACKACKWFSFCQGGCAYHRTLSMTGQSFYCEGIRFFCDHVWQKLNDLGYPQKS